MNLNKNYNESAAMFGVRVNASLLSLNELRELRNLIDHELEQKAQAHIDAIRAAVEAAQKDGFEIELGTANDHMFIFPHEDLGIVLDNN